MTILPTCISKFLNLNIVDVTPSNKLGELFKKLIKDRQKSGQTYNDLAEEMGKQNAEKNLALTEDEIIGNIVLLYFAGELC